MKTILSHGILALVVCCWPTLHVFGETYVAVFSGLGLSSTLRNVRLDQKRIRSDESCFVGSCTKTDTTLSQNPSAISDLDLKAPGFPPILGIKYGGYFDARFASSIGLELEYFYHGPRLRQQSATQCSAMGCQSVSVSEGRISFHTLAANLLIRPLHLLDATSRLLQPYFGIGFAGVAATAPNSTPFFSQSSDWSPALNLLAGVRALIPTSRQGAKLLLMLEFKRYSAGLRFNATPQLVSESNSCFIFCTKTRVRDESSTSLRYAPNLLTMGVGISY